MFRSKQLSVGSTHDNNFLLAIFSGILHPCGERILVGFRADPWPRKLSRNPVSEFAFAERWGEPFTGAPAAHAGS